MKRAVAEIIVDLLQDAGHDAKIYEGYSGRGMFGVETTGIDTSATSEYVAGLVAGKKDKEEFDEKERALLNAVVIRGDNLGLGYIVY